MPLMLCGRLLWFDDDPYPGTDEVSCYIENGALVIDAGRIVATGDATALRQQYPDVPCRDYGNKIILPGFIDTHTHLPQTGVIASYGEQLLDWLNDYTFPAELAFAEAAACAAGAEFYLQQLFAHGTTTAAVFGTSHAQSIDAFFTQAEKINACMIAGKVLMDRHGPADLLDTPERGYTDSRALIERWHGTGRLHYAVTPRFAPTSTPEQLTLAGTLLKEFDGLFMQTHLSENLAEVEWVKQLFPSARDYLDVYDQAGLLGSRSLFGHGIHLSDHELTRLRETGSSIAFCPSSNLFLGSGLLDAARLRAAGVRMSLATDVGAGTSFSMLYTLNQAYKVLQLQGQKLHPYCGFYQITLGNARALGLGEELGRLAPGYYADLVILDTCATDLSRYRSERAESLAEELFSAQILGDDRWIAETYVAGERVYLRDRDNSFFSQQEATP